MKLSFRRKQLSFTIALIIVLLIIGAHVIGILKPLEAFGWYILSPLKRGTYLMEIKMENFWDNLWTDEQSERARLEQEIIKLKERMVGCLDLKEENTILRDQLNLTADREHELILAKVIGKKPESFNHYLLLDVGSKDGVALNMPVILQNALVGKIVKVEEYVSELMLITDPASKMPAYIQNTELNGLVEGSLGAGYLKMSQIERILEVKAGDFVLTTGQNLNNYADIVIGQVDEIITQERDTFQSVTVIPYIDLDSLKQVFIIRN